MPLNRTYSARYKSGVMTPSPGGCVAAPLLIVPAAAILKSVALALALALLVFLVSTAVTSRFRRRVPVLVLSDRGVEIEGLPPIPWQDVASVRRDPDSRNGGAALVRLRRSLHSEFARLRLRGFVFSSLWRPAGADTMLLRLDLLEDPVDEALAAFDAFIRAHAS